MSQSNADKLRAQGIPVPMSTTSGQTKVRCPRCASKAKHKNKTDLSVDIDKGIWNCHNAGQCTYSGSVNKYIAPEKNYTKPAPRTNVTPLHQSVVDWFKARLISQQTLLKLNVMDGWKWFHDKGEIPDGQQWSMIFPYYENGELVNNKYRSAHKQFTFEQNAKLIFWNIDAIKGKKECAIVEGEIDLLTCEEAGFDDTTSVPNGASKSDNSRLEYLDNCWEAFEDKEKIILMTDDDEAGRALRSELIRRFGPERCWTVQYGEGCKDPNEHALKFGILSIKELRDNAQPCPIAGVFTAMDMWQVVTDLYAKGLPPGSRIGLRDSDTNEELISFSPGQMTVITGTPNSAKSETADHLMLNLAVQHDWRFAIHSPENYPKELHMIKLMEKLVNRHFSDISSSVGRLTNADMIRCRDFIEDHFFFLSSEKSSRRTFSLDDILYYGKSMLKRYGIKGIVIDPWNKLDHRRTTGFSTHDYIGESLTKVTNFDQDHSIHTFIVAHPTKLEKVKDFRKPKDGSTQAGGMIYPIVTLYDIADSSHWFNMTDNGISLYRNYNDGTTDMIVQKVKNKHEGQVGSIKFIYNKLTGRLTPINCLDSGDWLKTGGISVSAPAINFTEIVQDNSDQPHPLD